MGKPIGKRAKDFRLERLWTQKQMAAAIGVSEGTIVNLERGDSVSDLTRSKVEKYINLQVQVA